MPILKNIVTEDDVTQYEDAIDHDALLNYDADQHIDWTNATDNFVTTGNMTGGGISVASGVSPVAGGVLANTLAIGTNPTGFCNMSASGVLSFTGAGGYAVALNAAAFFVNGLPATGLFFALTGGARYSFRDLAGVDVFNGHVSGGQSYFYSRDGFATNGYTAASLSSNVNNYTGLTSGLTTGGGVARLTSSTAVNITGAVAPSPLVGAQKRVYNVGSNNITFTHQDTNSTAANRFLSVTGANIV